MCWSLSLVFVKKRRRREAWAIEKKKYGHMKVQVLRKNRNKKNVGT